MKKRYHVALSQDDEKIIRELRPIFEKKLDKTLTVGDVVRIALQSIAKIENVNVTG